jgi:MFS family permease
LEHATEGPSLVLPEGGDILKVIRQSPDFLRLWIASAILMGGDWFVTVAVMTLSLQLTHSPRVASMVLLSNTVPTFLATPVSGPLADRLNRKRLMIACCLISAVTALGFMFVTSADRVWICYACTAVIVVMVACCLPAATAALPCLVGPQNLVAANTLFGATWGIMAAIGSALGGWVASGLGRNAAFECDAVGLLISAAMIWSIRMRDFRSDTPHPLPPSDMDDMYEKAPEEEEGDVTFWGAINTLLHNPSLALVVLAKAFWGVGGGILLLLSVFPVQVYNLPDPDRGVGLMYSMRGVGTVLGPLLALMIVRNQTRSMPKAIWISLVMSGVFYIVFAQSPTLHLGAMSMLLANLGAGAVWVVSTTMMQLTIPNHLMGRLSAIDLGAFTLTMAVSQYFSGRYAEHANPREVGVVCGIACIATGFLWAILWAFCRRKRPIQMPHATLAEAKAQARRHEGASNVAQHPV